MDKFEVDLGVLEDERMKLDKLMDDYEECVELIGHLTRVFNREGYWDFKESLNGVYKRACKHENDLNSLIECMQQIHEIYMNSEGTLVDDVVSSQRELYVSSDSLNVEYILGGMRALTKDESYRLIKSLSIRGDINIGIDAALLLATTTLHTYTQGNGVASFKLRESTNFTYADRFKLFEAQTEEKWAAYGDSLMNSVDSSVYKSGTTNNGFPAVVRSMEKKDEEDIKVDDISELMLKAIAESDKEYSRAVEPQINEVDNDNVIYEMEIGSRIVHNVFKNLA